MLTILRHSPIQPILSNIFGVLLSLTMAMPVLAIDTSQNNSSLTLPPTITASYVTYVEVVTTGKAERWNLPEQLIEIPTSDYLNCTPGVWNNYQVLQLNFCNVFCSLQSQETMASLLGQINFIQSATTTTIMSGPNGSVVGQSTKSFK